MKVIEKGKLLTSAQVEKICKGVDSNTGMGMCILWVLDDARDNTNAANIATRAIAELEALQQRVAALEADNLKQYFEGAKEEYEQAKAALSGAERAK